MNAQKSRMIEKFSFCIEMDNFVYLIKYHEQFLPNILDNSQFYSDNNE